MQINDKNEVLYSFLSFICNYLQKYRHKLWKINFDMNTFIYSLGTNFVRCFSFLKIKAYNLIQLIIFIPEWPHWSLNSKGFLCHIRIYPIMEQRFNLRFGNLKFIFQRIHLQHLQHCKNVSVLMVFSLSWYSYFKYILILGFSM